MTMSAPKAAKAAVLLSLLAAKAAVLFSLLAAKAAELPSVVAAKAAELPSVVAANAAALLFSLHGAKAAARLVMRVQGRNGGRTR